MRVSENVVSSDEEARGRKPAGADRSVARVAHDMVNAVMAIDLRLGVMEVREPSDSVRALREPTNELLELVRELDGLVRTDVKS